MEGGKEERTVVCMTAHGVEGRGKSGKRDKMSRDRSHSGKDRMKRGQTRRRGRGLVQRGGANPKRGSGSRHFETADRTDKMAAQYFCGMCTVLKIDTPSFPMMVELNAHQDGHGPIVVRWSCPGLGCDKQWIQKRKRDMIGHIGRKHPDCPWICEEDDGSEVPPATNIE